MDTSPTAVLDFQYAGSALALFVQMRQSIRVGELPAIGNALVAVWSSAT